MCTDRFYSTTRANSQVLRKTKRGTHMHQMAFRTKGTDNQSLLVEQINTMAFSYSRLVVSVLILGSITSHTNAPSFVSVLRLLNSTLAASPDRTCALTQYVDAFVLTESPLSTKYYSFPARQSPSTSFPQPIRSAQ